MASDVAQCRLRSSGTGSQAAWLRLLVWRYCDHNCACGAYQAAVFAAVHFQPIVLTSPVARPPACPPLALCSAAPRRQRWPCSKK